MLSAMMGYWALMPCNLYHDKTEAKIPPVAKAAYIQKVLRKMSFRQYRISQFLCSASRTGINDVTISNAPIEWRVKPLGLEITVHL